jgi:hypothetical protein
LRMYQRSPYQHEGSEAFLPAHVVPRWTNLSPRVVLRLKRRKACWYNVVETNGVTWLHQNSGKSVSGGFLFRDKRYNLTTSKLIV